MIFPGINEAVFGRLRNNMRGIRNIIRPENMTKLEPSGIHVQKNNETIIVKRVIINAHNTHLPSKRLTRTLRILLSCISRGDCTS
jgi:hypothetical protein